MTSDKFKIHMLEKKQSDLTEYGWRPDVSDQIVQIWIPIEDLTTLLMQLLF